MSIDLLVKDIYDYIDSVAPFSSALPKTIARASITLNMTCNTSLNN